MRRVCNWIYEFVPWDPVSRAKPIEGCDCQSGAARTEGETTVESRAVHVAVPRDGNWTDSPDFFYRLPAGCTARSRARW